MSDLEIPLLDPDAPVGCPGCGWSGSWHQARLRIVDMAELIPVADKVPAGQCPECRELVFLAKDRGIDNHGLSYAARELFPLFREMQSGLEKLLSDGVINAENMGEHWVWLKTTIERIELRGHEVLVAELERILGDDLGDD